jgi:hypothetical protein
MNVDRTVRNTNMLWWRKELWLIDHGAALYFHHSWDNWQEQATRPFERVKDHVLLSKASQLEKLDQQFSAILTKSIISSIVDLVPDEWLVNGSPFKTPEEHRSAYTLILHERVMESHIFLKAAEDARKTLI